MNNILKLFGFFFLAGCANQSLLQKNGILEYESSLPGKESINASLANYEMIRNDMSISLSNQNFSNILDIGLKFYEIFENDDEYGFVNYYLGCVLGYTVTNDAWNHYFKQLNKNQRMQLRIRLIKADTGNIIPVYSNDHHELIIENRQEYELEKKVISRKIKSVIKPAENKKTFDKNWSFLTFIYKRYPDSDEVSKIVTNELYFPKKYQSKKNSDEYTEMKELFALTAPGTAEISNISLRGDFINVRNKPNNLYSRKIASLELWEVVDLLFLYTNVSDNSVWARISFRNGTIGFIEEKFLDMAYELPMANETDILLKGIDEFYNHNYFRAAELVAPLINSNLKFSEIEERAVILFFRICGKIAERYTALDSKYKKFVHANPLFFSYDADENQIIQSRSLFQYMVKLNNDSRYLHLFRN